MWVKTPDGQLVNLDHMAVVYLADMSTDERKDNWRLIGVYGSSDGTALLAKGTFAEVSGVHYNIEKALGSNIVTTRQKQHSHRFIGSYDGIYRCSCGEERTEDELRTATR